MEDYGAEPVIPYRRTSKLRKALRVGRNFVVRGVKRLVKLFRKRVSIERVFGRAKEWLLLDHLRVRGLQQTFIHACLTFSSMLAVALTAVRQGKSGLICSLKHYTI